MKPLNLISPKSLEVEPQTLIAAVAQPPKSGSMPKPAPLVLSQDNLIVLLMIGGGLVAAWLKVQISGLAANYASLRTRCERSEQRAEDLQALLLREYVSKSDLAGTADSLDRHIQKLDGKLDRLTEQVTGVLQRCAKE